jgi:hypothetical protein
MKRLNDAGIGSLAAFLLEWHKRGGLIIDCGLVDAWATDVESDSDGLVEIRARDSVTGAPITWTAEACHWQAPERPECSSC